MRHKQGFTLIELMITVVIAAILAAIAMPMYSNYITKAKTRSAASDLVALSLVIESLYQRSLKYPIPTTNPTTTTTQTKAYATSWQPTESDSFDYVVDVTATTYTLTAQGKTGTRNVGCTLTLNQENLRTISGGSTCGGLTSW